ncbi:hypothetical protein PFISCL1PPCAC_26317, partial [Pristionchus fissidentatus]
LQAFVDSLAEILVDITVKSNGIDGMTNVFLPFYKDVTDYNLAVHILHREGLESGAPIQRNIDSIKQVAEEYGRTLKNAAWSSIDSNGKSRY